MILSSFCVTSACAAPHEPASRRSTAPTAIDSTTARTPRSSPTGGVVTAASPSRVLEVRPPECQPWDWTPRTLAPLLRAGKKPNASHADRPSTRIERPFDTSCSDHPEGTAPGLAVPLTVEGVELRVKSSTAAGTSGRRWAGNQCTFELASADRSGRSVELGPDVVPPFNAISALTRSGSAVWLEVSFNGYTKEFPKGGNRVVAVDLCDGRVVWRSKDSVSNGGILLVGDYLVTAFGFTSERRYLHVLDARSGASVQKLPIVETI
jgi:hypothetical protein